MLGLVFGTSPWWKEDYKRWREFNVLEDIKIGVNRNCQSEFDICVSQHSEFFPEHMNISNEIPQPYFKGTSGLHACWAAFNRLYCDKIVLIGMPLSDPYNHQYTMDCWKIFELNYKERVKSLSLIKGNKSFTSSLFGKPTKEWIYG